MHCICIIFFFIDGTALTPLANDTEIYAGPTKFQTSEDTHFNKELFDKYCQVCGPRPKVPEVLRKMKSDINYDTKNLLQGSMKCNKEREKLLSRVKSSSRSRDAQLISQFLASLCTPVTVGNLAGHHLKQTTANDLFPQFSADVQLKPDGNYRTNSFTCEVCTPLTALL